MNQSRTENWAHLNRDIEIKSGTRWRRPIKCLKLQVSFRKRATDYRALLRKMTCEGKASYGSSPLYIKRLTMFVPWLIHTCYMTHSYTCHDWFLYVPWLIQIGAMTHSYLHLVWIIQHRRQVTCRDSFVCATWLNHMHGRDVLQAIHRLTLTGDVLCESVLRKTDSRIYNLFCAKQIYIYIFDCICANLYNLFCAKQIYIYICICARDVLCESVLRKTDSHTYIYMFTYVCIHTYIYIYVYVYICVYITYIYIYIYIRSTSPALFSLALTSLELVSHLLDNVFQIWHQISDPAHMFETFKIDFLAGAPAKFATLSSQHDASHKSGIKHVT